MNQSSDAIVEGTQVPAISTMFPTLEETGFTAAYSPLYFRPEGQGGDGTQFSAVPRTLRTVHRTDTGAFLGLVDQKNYEIVQNSRLRQVVVEAFAGFLGDKLDLRASISEEIVNEPGTKVRFEYFLPVIPDPTGKFGQVGAEYTYKKSDIGFKVYIENSFDGGASVKISTKAVDLVCMNGMVMIKKQSISKKHEVGFDYQDLVNFLRAQIKDYYSNVKTWQLWAAREIDWKQARRPLAEGVNIPNELVASLLARFKTESLMRGKNVWALYSALTYYSTHNSEEFRVEGSQSAGNIRQALNGRSKLVSKILGTDQWTKLAGAAVAS